MTGGGESEKIKDQTKQGVDGHKMICRNFLRILPSDENGNKIGRLSVSAARCVVVWL